MQSIKVKHNVEMAHRLSQTPGKCEAIHGHSWWVELEIWDDVDSNGMILEFGEVKRRFRTYLDSNFDHHLLLWDGDEWASEHVGTEGEYKALPGLAKFPEDPTTENFARHIGHWAADTFGISNTRRYRVTVWETSVNAATWEG